MAMKSPAHPGELVKELCLEPLGLTVTAGAIALGVSRKALSEVINGRRGVSAEMAVRLAKAFGSTARVWLDMQTAYDLAQIDPRSVKVKPYKAPEQKGSRTVAPA